MVEINKINIRTWSMLGSRGTFGVAMYEIAPFFDDIFAITADFTKSSGLDRYSKKYPAKYLTVGIAEQNLIGIASALASEGKVVFATSFASFITTRCFEQVKIHLGYMHHNVKLVGLAAGIGVTYQGNTHYGIDDVSLMRTIPCMTIVTPADCTEVVKATIASAQFDGPLYLRLVGEQNNPIVYTENYDFQIGKAITIREGKDVTIIASGTMVYRSLQAADILSGHGIEATVVNMHTIKPLDKSIIDRACEQSKLIVTVEEGTVIGGLGSSVAEYNVSKKNAPAQLILGINDFFPKAGSYYYMLDQCRLSPEKIAEDILHKYNSL
jgi:transketolase